MGQTQEDALELSVSAEESNTDLEERTYCHNRGEWHAVPIEVIKLALESDSRVEYTTEGGNRVLADPVFVDGKKVRIDFCTPVTD